MLLHSFFWNWEVDGSFGNCSLDTFRCPSVLLLHELRSSTFSLLGLRDSLQSRSRIHEGREGWFVLKQKWCEWDILGARRGIRSKEIQEEHGHTGRADFFCALHMYAFVIIDAMYWNDSIFFLSCQCSCL